MNGMRIGSVFGFEIRIDYSWFIIFFLILWTLSAGFFPAHVPGLTHAGYLVMGLVGTILFFCSLLAHELSHSVVARRKGIAVEGITLFIFGGMARTRMDAETPGDELAIAGVGPLMSLALGLLFLALGWISGRLGLGPAVVTVAAYLGVINLALAGFNILPGFPLDGGRVFRALAWKHTGDVTRATRWASTGGRWLGYLLIATGLLEAFAGAVIGGIWLVFIGWFLRGAAEMSLRQHLLHQVLEGVTAREVMSERPEVVDPSLSLQELVDDHFLRRRYQSFPVVQDGRLEGLVTLAQVKQVPRDRWPFTPVAAVMAPTGEDILVTPGQPLSEVVAKLQPAGVRRVLVAEGHRLVGIISASDVAAWASRSQELSGTAR